MVWLLIALTLVDKPGPGSLVVEEGCVRVRVQVAASLYTYELTNVGDDPITRFEVPYHNGYAFTVPDGWKSETDEITFRAWATGERYAIHPGHTGEFSFRVTSKGSAVLGHVDVRAESASGESTALRNVWGAVATPRSYVLHVAGVALAIFVVHALLLIRSDRRAA
jgi:hypothetical protein